MWSAGACSRRLTLELARACSSLDLQSDEPSLGDSFARNELQILVLVKLVRRDKGPAKNPRLANQYAPAEFLHAPSGIWIVGITRHKLDLRRVSMEKYAIAVSNLLAGSILQYKGSHASPHVLPHDRLKQCRSPLIAFFVF